MENINKIYKIKYLFIILVAALILTGCNKEWLDKKPDQSVAVPSTLRDFEAMLDDFSINNSTSYSIAEVASEGHYTNDVGWNLSASSVPQRNAYTWSKQHGPYTDVLDWNFSYKSILYANVVLEGLEKIKPLGDVDMETWNRLKGQALFLRARAFFELAQVFSPPYNANTAGADLGIPLRLESDITIPASRSTVQQTYDQIVGDFLLAKDLLPAKGLFKSRASKYAVFALLARLYLNIEDYPKAFENANACLQIDNTLMDFNSLSTTATFIGDYKVNPEVIFHETGLNYSFINTRCLIDNDLYNSYVANDLRKSIFFRVSGTNISFKGNYNSKASSILPDEIFLGPATDEMYLIRSECNARAGKVAEAMKDLNDLLKTRWKKVAGISTYIDQTATNADDALVKILGERRKELILRGQRWADLRRLNRDERFKITLKRTIGGNTYTLEPNSYKYTFPIPDDVIQQSGMPQNTGWN